MFIIHSQKNIQTHTHTNKRYTDAKCFLMSPIVHGSTNQEVKLQIYITSVIVLLYHIIRNSCSSVDYNDLINPIHSWISMEFMDSFSLGIGLVCFCISNVDYILSKN
ncbi:unnamed protein product [Schistosoma haematobium]|nr:unnamed protein product [Schistosoma haematobium]